MKERGEKGKSFLPLPAYEGKKGKRKKIQWAEKGGISEKKRRGKKRMVFPLEKRGKKRGSITSKGKRGGGAITGREKKEGGGESPHYLYFHKEGGRRETAGKLSS